jgi:hypothetical protein
MRVDDSWYTVMNKNCYRARGAFQALDEQNKGLTNIPTICFNLLKYRIQDSVVGKALTTANQPDQDRVTPNYQFTILLYHHIFVISHALSPFRPGFRSINIKHK